jgi:hypothetical protein
LQNRTKLIDQYKKATKVINRKRVEIIVDGQWKMKGEKLMPLPYSAG